MGAPQELTTIADFESSQPLTTSDGTALTLTKDADQVARGYGALAVSVNGSAELNVPQTAVTKTPTVSLWAKADGSATLTGIFTTADGETVEAAFGPIASANWQFLSCKAPDGAQVSVLGSWNGWYVIRYGNIEGYARSEYITLNYS